MVTTRLADATTAQALLAKQKATAETKSAEQADMVLVLRASREQFANQAVTFEVLFFYQFGVKQNGAPSPPIIFLRLPGCEQKWNNWKPN